MTSKCETIQFRSLKITLSNCPQGRSTYSAYIRSIIAHCSPVNRDFFSLSFCMWVWIILSRHWCYAIYKAILCKHALEILSVLNNEHWMGLEAQHRQRQRKLKKDKKKTTGASKTKIEIYDAWLIHSLQRITFANLHFASLARREGKKCVHCRWVRRFTFCNWNLFTFVWIVSVRHQMKK